MGGSLDALKERINTIEIQNDTQKQALSELSGKFSELQREQQAYMEELDDARSDDQGKLAEFDSHLEQLEEELDSLSTQVEQSGDQLDDLEDQLTAIEEELETGDPSVAVLRRELQLVKAMELLTRSRLFLVENNLGLAEDDIRTARDLLDAMVVPDYQQATLDEIILRLDMALGNLPESPILAAEDLEIAWQLLKVGLPDETAANTAGDVTLTPEATAMEETSESTPTPTPSP
jgi:chromosome segregation ATPase